MAMLIGEFDCVLTAIHEVCLLYTPPVCPSYGAKYAGADAASATEGYGCSAEPLFNMFTDLRRDQVGVFAGC